MFKRKLPPLHERTGMEGYMLYDKSLERTHVLLKQPDQLIDWWTADYTRGSTVPSACLQTGCLTSFTCWYCT